MSCLYADYRPILQSPLSATTFPVLPDFKTHQQSSSHFQSNPYHGTIQQISRGALPTHTLPSAMTAAVMAARQCSGAGSQDRSASFGGEITGSPCLSVAKPPPHHPGSLTDSSAVKQPSSISTGSPSLDAMLPPQYAAHLPLYAAWLLSERGNTYLNSLGMSVLKTFLC